MRPVAPLRRVALLVAATALLAACSSGGGGPERSSDAPTSTSAPTTASAAETTDVVTGEPVLRLGVIAPVTLDPAAASPASASAMAVADLLHDSLTALDADGAPVPELADFVPNESRTAWRFTLVEGAAFADGSPIEADDVVTSLERIRAQGGGSLAAIQLEHVTSVVAVDPRTVEVALDRPSALLPEVLSAPLYGIIDRDLPPTAVGAPLNPSGAFGVREATADRLVLERRRGAGPALVAVRIFFDEAAAAGALAGGELDWAPVGADGLGDVGAGGAPSLTPFHATVLLGIGTTVEPLVRLPLRQALALAVDRAALAAGVFGPTGIAARGLVPAGVPGAAVGCAGPCGPDLERARQLVAEAFPEGPPPPLRLLTDETSTHDALARLLAQQLQAVGLTLEVEPVDDATYAARLAARQEQLFLTSSLGVARSPASSLLTWASGSPDNLTGYRNDLVDLALAAAVDQPDRAARLARWQEIEAAILGDAPVVPLVQLQTVAAVSDRIDGLVVRADGTLDLAGVTFTD